MASPLFWIVSGEEMMNFVSFCNCLIFFSLFWMMISLIASLISWAKFDLGGPDIRSLLLEDWVNKKLEIRIIFSAILCESDCFSDLRESFVFQRVRNR